ncbi:MAG: metalloregulator ArsR/SmtB family transcription factor [Meiothermus sp.]|nr:metalloregulator ArsR/SmtB family transcription factor [Meiothermus sp.]
MSAVLALAEPSSPDLETLAAVFKALSDPARLRILDYLASDPDGKCCDTERGICACDLEAVTGLSQPTVSHHMKLLVAAGLVSAARRGKWMYYAVNSSGFGALREFLQTINR